MNLEKHENVSYKSPDNIAKIMNSKFYKRHGSIYFDGACSFFEVVNKKRAITDKVPIAAAFFILGHAKLCVMEFVRDVEECIMPDAMRILYMGIL